MLTVGGKGAGSIGLGGGAGVEDDAVLLVMIRVSDNRFESRWFTGERTGEAAGKACVGGSVCEGPLLQTAQGRLFWFLQLFLDLIPRRDVAARETGRIARRR